MFITPISSLQPLSGLQAAEQTQETGNSMQFSSILKDAVQNLQEAQAVSDNDGYNLAMGNVDNLPALMVNSQKAELALTMTVQMTNRVVSAYKEIMQMQV